MDSGGVWDDVGGVGSVVRDAGMMFIWVGLGVVDY